MSGHNKWSQIKHKKAATDGEKSKVFSKYARLLALESKKVNGNSNSPSLRSIVEKAKKDNMPADNINRAIQKGFGIGGAFMEKVVYEVYGPGGVALIIEGITDNKNRTGPEIKHLLSKQGFELAVPGSVLWAFTQKNSTWVPNTTLQLGEQDGTALRQLIAHIKEHDDIQDVYTNALNVEL